MKKILNRLQEFDTLSKDEAHDLIYKMSKGEFNNSEIAAFLFAFNLRDIQTEEILGFRAAMLSLALPFETQFNTTDLCGTGGDQKDTFNISTLASFVVAGSGIKVTKHGNYGVSSFCGSSNILESFGYQFTNDQSILNKQLEAANICFLHAPVFHPAMKNVAPIRKELGVKTFFNLLGPLVNPANPSHQLIGVFSPKVQRLYQFIHQHTNKTISLVHSMDGYDEISLTSPFKLISNKGEQLLNPDDIGMPRISQSALTGGNNLNDAKTIFFNILNNKGTTEQNNAVLANAGAAIANFNNTNILEGIETARTSLISGKALQSFNSMLQIN
jgi:anthranilate phosphoribosyltransferase